MGWACFICWVLFSGSVGGLIYSLTTGDSHKLRLPRRIQLRREPPPARPALWDRFKFSTSTTGIDTGFVGHMVIGAAGGILLFSLVVSHLNFDVSGVMGTARFRATKSLEPKDVMVLIHTLGIGIVGGFLGLRLIVKIADETMIRLDRQMEELKTESQRQKLESTIQTHLLNARALIAQPDLEGARQEIEKALRIRPTKHAEFLKAMVLSREGDLAGAQAALDRAADLEPDKVVEDNGGVFWNKACYYARVSPVAIDAVIENLDKALKIRPKALSNIKEDSDLAALVDNPTFKAHFKLQ